MSRVRQFPQRGAQRRGGASMTLRQSRDLPHPPLNDADRRMEAERRARFLTMRQAAAHAGYDVPDSLYKQLRRDLVALHRPTARRVLVRVGDLEDWITKHSTQVTAIADAMHR